MTNDKLKQHIDNRLNKIESLLCLILGLVEQMADDACLVSSLQQRLNETRKIVRELEYEQWFKGQKNEREND